VCLTGTVKKVFFEFMLIFMKAPDGKIAKKGRRKCTFYIFRKISSIFLWLRDIKVFKNLSFSKKTVIHKTFFIKIRI
jgi:hypothetical protein